MERLVELTHPPVVNEVYLVPCITLDVYGELPVMGKHHSDPILGPDAAKWHIHVDHRFVTKEQIRLLGIYSLDSIMLNQYGNFGKLTIPALGLEGDARVTKDNISVHESPLLCLREMPGFQHITYPYGGGETRWYAGDSINHYAELENQFEGKKLKGACKYCPHHGIPLGSIAPHDGVITCPGHMLDWDAKTGKLIRRTKKNTNGEGYKHRC